MIYHSTRELDLGTLPDRSSASAVHRDELRQFHWQGWVTTLQTNRGLRHKAGCDDDERTMTALKETMIAMAMRSMAYDEHDADNE